VAAEEEAAMAHVRGRRLSCAVAFASILIGGTTVATAAPRSPDGLADRLPARFAGCTVPVTANY
jgi:hypothetical protein